MRSRGPLRPPRLSPLPPIPDCDRTSPIYHAVKYAREVPWGVKQPPTHQIRTLYIPESPSKPSLGQELLTSPQRYAASFRSKEERLPSPKTPYRDGVGPQTYADAYIRYGKSRWR